MFFLLLMIALFYVFATFDDCAFPKMGENRTIYQERIPYVQTQNLRQTREMETRRKRP